jgi:CRISPR/Cas system endoribonuclease Cas6 (RAMP superfamily)
VSPTIVEINARAGPFPVFPVIFEHYIAVWNRFSDALIDPSWTDRLDHIRITDFRISCVASPFGPGSQGWVKLEMEKGRSEADIAMFNRLLDFAFYCGTGLHTVDGLGQTRRMERAVKQNPS